MKKFGFTLTEILLTLAIIGVVATLTTPALVKNTGTAKIGPQLAKFVNTWETGVGALMLENNMNVLSEQSKNMDGLEADFIDDLTSHIVMAKLEDTDKIVVKTSGGTTVGTYANSDKDCAMYQLKDGTVMIIVPEVYGGGDGIRKEGPYEGDIAGILVDIGGLKGKHRYGKEVFEFILDNSGMLIPFGSKAHIKYASGDTAAKKECDPSSDSIERLQTCAGAVADNGWKAPW